MKLEKLPVWQSHPLTPLGAVVFGLPLLLAGRKLYWLFVGIVGFAVGFEAAEALVPGQHDGALIAGAVLGIVGAIAAILLQKVAIGIGGFLAGGYFAVVLARTWEMHFPADPWLLFLVGGVVGGILMYAVFDWTLIFFSSVAGAHLLVHAVHLEPEAASAAFICLTVLGIIVQARGSARARAAD